jgi:glycosyltransferase involved in cell wall biosynthesis
MKTVADSEPTAWFLIVGGAPFNVPDDYPLRLRRLAGELGIGDRVVFTGHLDDVRPALSSLDVFVHAGDPEPFGLVVLEAMAMTRPVVAFGHGALPEIVVDGKTGVLVRPTDEQALSDAILQLLRDPDMRTRVGAAARTRVERQFTAERMVAAVSSVYRDMASEG